MEHVAGVEMGPPGLRVSTLSARQREGRLRQRVGDPHFVTRRDDARLVGAGAAQGGGQDNERDERERQQAAGREHVVEYMQRPSPGESESVRKVGRLTGLEPATP